MMWDMADRTRRAKPVGDPRIDLDDDGYAIPPAKQRIHETIKSMRESMGLSQVELSRRVRVPQAYVSRWELSRIPPEDDIFRLEVDGFGVLPGTIMTEAGFHLPATTVESAIQSDARLRPAQRAMLLAAYRAAVGELDET